VKALLFILSLCVLVAIVASAYTFYRQDQVNHDICVASNHQNEAISNSLHRSLKTIPTLSYYKQHPAERDRALAEIHHQLRVFAPRNC
jgi:hypothetical protein